MRVWEYGKEHEKTLLFLPCTAEPEWVFADSVGLLCQRSRLKRAAKSLIGTARRKSRHDTAMVALLSNIFHRWNCMKFRRWIPRSL